MNASPSARSSASGPARVCASTTRESSSSSSFTSRDVRVGAASASREIRATFRRERPGHASSSPNASPRSTSSALASLAPPESRQPRASRVARVSNHSTSSTGDAASSPRASTPSSPRVRPHLERWENRFRTFKVMHLDPMAEERRRLTERRVREQTSAIEDIRETVQEYDAPVPDEVAIKPTRQPSMRLRLDAHLASHALRRQSEEPSAAASTDVGAEEHRNPKNPPPDLGETTPGGGGQNRATSPDPDARRHRSGDAPRVNASDRSSPSALYSYASRASSRYRDGSGPSRREAEDVEARLRALGWRGGGASSEKEKEKTMRAHVRGTLSRRDGRSVSLGRRRAARVSRVLSRRRGDEGIGRRRNR